MRVGLVVGATGGSTRAVSGGWGQRDDGAGQRGGRDVDVSVEVVGLTE